VTYFEEIGGEIALSAIIHDFVERVCSDTMIGYLFARVDRARLERMEYEHAAQFLGAELTYSGRDLHAAHRRHAIMGGQFGRRRQILKSTLERHRVPTHVIDAWLSHQDVLREQVTSDRPDECTPREQAGPAGSEPRVDQGKVQAGGPRGLQIKGKR
jgi:hemoglobin